MTMLCWHNLPFKSMIDHDFDGLDKEFKLKLIIVFDMYVKSCKI